MSREEVQKLLGGYATGTLTAEEQQALFEAALEDQELFDTLAREQGLRDLLRDPSAKAHLLAALDEPRPHGIPAWIRRPLVAGLAMASLAAIGVALWQVSRHSAPVPTAAPERQIVAELKNQPVPAPPPTPAPPSSQETTPTAALTRELPPQPVDEARRRRDFKTEAAAARPAAPVPAPSKDVKQESDLVAEAPVVAQSKPTELNFSNQLAQAKEQIQVQANAPPASVNQAFQNQMKSVNLQDQPTENARALYYGGQLPINGRNAFADSVTPETSQAGARKAEKKAPQVTAALSAAGIGGAQVVAHLGIRCSIVRDGNREVDLSTALYAGESVKLRLTPNADGFLTVTEGEGDTARVVARGPVRNQVPFETPVLKSDAPGQRQFQVTLTRIGMEKGAAASFGAFSRANLVESASDKETATYVVAGDAVPSPQQLVAPLTLTWR